MLQHSDELLRTLEEWTKTPKVEASFIFSGGTSGTIPSVSSIVVSCEIKGERNTAPGHSSLLPWAILRRIRQIQTALRQDTLHPSYEQTEEQAKVCKFDIDSYLRLAHAGMPKAEPSHRGNVDTHLHNLLTELLRAEAAAAQLKGEMVPKARAICWGLWNNVDG